MDIRSNQRSLGADDRDKKTGFIDTLMSKGQSEGALLIVVILFLLLLFFSQNKTKTDILAISFVGKNIVNATFYSGEISYSNKLFSSYPSGPYSIIAFPTNRTGISGIYAEPITYNQDGTVTVNGVGQVLSSNDTYKLNNIGEGTVVFYLDYQKYECMDVILINQAYGQVDWKKVCKNV